MPKTTSPGKYPMCIENFMPTTSIGYLQFYVNCAFVNIIGPEGDPDRVCPVPWHL